MIDSQPITFPKLGWTFDFPNYFTVFGLAIYWYAVIICVGVVLAYIYCTRRREQFGLTHDNILDGLLFGVPIGIIGARLWYCLFAPAGEITKFTDIFQIRDGGLAIYGAIFSVGVFIIIFCRIKKLRLGNVLDIVSLGFLIGQAVGRWGNFVNREVYGKATALPWGMRVAKVSVHPLFLYEFLWNTVGFVILHFVSKKRKFPGQIALMYMAWYGLGRGLMEGMRDPQFVETLGNLPIHTIVAFTACVISVFILVVKFIEIKKLGPASFEYEGKGGGLFSFKSAKAEQRRKEYKPMYDLGQTDGDADNSAPDDAVPSVKDDSSTEEPRLDTDAETETPRDEDETAPETPIEEKKAKKSGKSKKTDAETPEE